MHSHFIREAEFLFLYSIISNYVVCCRQRISCWEIETLLLHYISFKLYCFSHFLPLPFPLTSFCHSSLISLSPPLSSFTPLSSLISFVYHCTILIPPSKFSIYIFDLHLCLWHSHFLSPSLSPLSITSHSSPSLLLIFFHSSILLDQFRVSHFLSLHLQSAIYISAFDSFLPLTLSFSFPFPLTSFYPFSLLSLPLSSSIFFSSSILPHQIQVSLLLSHKIWKHFNLHLCVKLHIQNISFT